MSNEHTFVLFRDATGTVSKTDRASNGSGNDAADRISAALGELNQVRIGPMSRADADLTLGLLSQAQSVVKSLMFDVARRVSDSDSDTDPAEVLRQGARVPGRESKRMAKVARQLAEMPKVRERFAAVTSPPITSTPWPTPPRSRSPSRGGRRQPVGGG